MDSLELDFRRRWLDWLTGGAAAVVSALGVWLLLHKLGMAGFTWDEIADFDITLDYSRHGRFFDNVVDPSQGRLSHILATPFLHFLGETSFAFKLPFALAGLGGAGMLWWVCRRAYSRTTAALVVAFYLSNPYVLAASRTAATAGDALVLVLAIGCVGALHRWVTTTAFWPWGALTAVACGAATAAKWTNGLWLPGAMAVALWYGRRRHGSLLAGAVWCEIATFGAIACVVAMLGSPTLLHGLPFIQDAIASSASYDTRITGYLGMYRQRPPWQYFPLLTLSKLTPPMAALFLVAGAFVAGRAAHLRTAGPLVPISLLALLPCLPLAHKGFQNAQYYVGAVVTVAVIVAAFVDRMQRAERLRAPMLVTVVALLFCQLGFSFSLSPDFLQAGRHFGASMQGEFWGPAVNHCQCGPWTLAQLNALAGTGEAPVAYVLEACHNALMYDQRYGPLVYRGGVLPYPAAGKPKGPYYVIVNRVYGLGETTQAAYDEKIARREEAVATCHAVPDPWGSYKIYRCPSD
jgi:hypothetical protein